MDVLLGISYEYALYSTKFKQSLRHEILEKYFVSYIILLSQYSPFLLKTPILNIGIYYFHTSRYANVIYINVNLHRYFIINIYKHIFVCVNVFVEMYMLL